MRQYLDFLKHILEQGTRKDDRTNTGTISVFGYQMRFNLHDGFPLLTTKKVHLHSILHELLWFVRGDTNLEYLVQNNVRIWNEWPYVRYAKSPDFQGETIEQYVEKVKSNHDFALKYGNLGPVYGKQWRDFYGVDQLMNVIEEIKKNPTSRRLIVSTWNPAQIEDMALPPCHILYQFYVNGNQLSLQLYQRSGDAFLGIPFNIASYALLLMMVAKVTGLEANEFIHTIGDAHIYLNHLDQVKLQVSRTPKKLPSMKITRDTTIILDFRADDFVLENYDPYPIIKGKVAV